MYKWDMTFEAVQAETRTVPVEFGSFYFGNWPLETSAGIPFDVKDPRSMVASFTDDGIAFFSDCNEGESVLVRIYFFDVEPDELPPGTQGRFVISSKSVSTATLDMLPQEPFSPPFQGNVRVHAQRLNHETSSTSDNETTHGLEKWQIYIWPA